MLLHLVLSMIPGYLPDTAASIAHRADHISGMCRLHCWRLHLR
jgi:hypothetical protein